MDSLRREMVYYSLDVDDIGFFLHIDASFYVKTYIRIVDVQQANDVAWAIRTINIDVVILVAVVVKLVNDTFSIDNGITISRQSSFKINIGGKLAKLLIVKQLFQIEPLGVDKSLESALLV